MTDFMTVGRGDFKQNVTDYCNDTQMIGISNAGEIEHLLIPMDDWMELTRFHDVSDPVNEVTHSDLNKNLKTILEAKDVVIVRNIRSSKQTHVIADVELYNALVEGYDDSI
jgi:hypothetical protein